MASSACLNAATFITPSLSPKSSSLIPQLGVSSLIFSPTASHRKGIRLGASSLSAQLQFSPLLVRATSEEPSAGASVQVESKFSPSPVQVTTLEEPPTESSVKHESEFSALPVQGTLPKEESSTDPLGQFSDILSDLKSKWDSIENKTNVFVYGGGALAAFWLSSNVVATINSVPLLPKVMELVGLGYTVWFVYSRVLFKDSREILVSEIEDFKAKIIGAEDND